MLPQLQGRPMVTDGGMETDLIFNHHAELPCFAAFPLIDTATGQSLLRHYYDGYAAVARQAGAGLLLEAPTWRANPDWGDQLGYGPADLARVNAAAIAMLIQLRGSYATTITDVIISGMVGPRGDGYQPGQLMEPDAAAAYHRPQIQAFADAGADMITALTWPTPARRSASSRRPAAPGCRSRSPSPWRPTAGFPAVFPSPRPSLRSTRPPPRITSWSTAPTRITSRWPWPSRDHGASASSGCAITPHPKATPSSTKPPSSTTTIQACSPPRTSG